MSARMRITVTEWSEKWGYQVIARFDNADDAFMFAEVATSKQEDYRSMTVTDTLGYINKTFYTSKPTPILNSYPAEETP